MKILLETTTPLGKTSINSAELHALRTWPYMAKQQHVKKLIVQSDSEYVYCCLNNETTSQWQQEIMVHDIPKIKRSLRTWSSIFLQSKTK